MYVPVSMVYFTLVFLLGTDHCHFHTCLFFFFFVTEKKEENEKYKDVPSHYPANKNYNWRWSRKNELARLCIMEEDQLMTEKSGKKSSDLKLSCCDEYKVSKTCKTKT